MIAHHPTTLDRLLSKAADGRRLSVDEALQLAGEASLADLGLAADVRRNQLHPGRRVSYIVERNINYTNVCNTYCRFCAFYRAPGRPGGYTLSKEELAAKIDETVAAGGIQILLQGGLNPELRHRVLRRPVPLAEAAVPGRQSARPFGRRSPARLQGLEPLDRGNACRG